MAWGEAQTAVAMVSHRPLSLLTLCPLSQRSFLLPLGGPLAPWTTQVCLPSPSWPTCKDAQVSVQLQPQKGTPGSEQGPVLCVATCTPGDWAQDGPALRPGMCPRNRKSLLVVEEAMVG